GSLLVLNSSDAERLVGVTTITGDLDIEANGLEELDLSSLKTGGGSFVCFALSAPMVSLPAVTSVGQDVVVQQCPTVSAPVLATVGGVVAVESTALTTFTLPVLETGSIVVLQNSALTAVGAPMLASAPRFDIESNAMLTTISFPAVSTSTSFFVRNNPML